MGGEGLDSFEGIFAVASTSSYADFVVGTFRDVANMAKPTSVKVTKTIGAALIRVLCDMSPMLGIVACSGMS